MTQTSRTIPRTAASGTATGVFFMSIFGTLWAFTGILGLQGWGVPLLLVTAVSIGIALFIGGVSLTRASRQLSNQVSKKDIMREKRTRLWFNIIFAAEGLAIVIAIAVCNATRHTELIPIIIAIIVGVHFLPMATLFRVRLYYFTGALLCLIAIITLLFVPSEVTIGELQINVFMSVVGFGSAIILWGTGIGIWLMGRRLLGSIQKVVT